jgi:hypothetical protein
MRSTVGMHVVYDGANVKIFFLISRQCRPVHNKKAHRETMSYF